MFNTATPSSKAQVTRSHLLSTALRIFRERGLEAATMRDLASAAGASLGSAYYYFPSKEAIIQAYYDDVQAEHGRRLQAALSGARLDLKDRLRAAFHSKLDILQADRKLLSALFRYTGEPHHPLSTLGEGTRKNRQESTAVFAAALGNERLPDDIRTLLPTVLWALHLGILLYFIYDDSPEQQRTRRLVDGAVTLIARAISLARLPILRPVRGSVLSLLRDAGLLPESDSPHVPIQESQP
ncbi:MAG TPA: TetR/AcrR family transcriptional regulator [Candidatus Methylomirabilis sp.]|nr:TetR/AcrR family transcriptional regulator [Candidatus Methylomirabilis sp.]